MPKINIILIFAPANIIFKKPFHWILNTGSHEKSMRRAVGGQSRERHLY